MPQWVITGQFTVEAATPDEASVAPSTDAAG